MSNQRKKLEFFKNYSNVKYQEIEMTWSLKEYKNQYDTDMKNQV